MKFKLAIIVSSFLLSCNPKVVDKSDSQVKSFVMKSEIKYFDRTIQLYKNQSDLGYYYFTQDSILTSKCINLKTKMQNGISLKDSDEQDLISYLENVLNKSEYIDKERLSQFRKTLIQTTTDIDYIEHFGKCCFSNILQNSRVIPFDIYGTSASTDSWTIKQGEEFKIDLTLTANNASRPLEWFRVKSGTNTLNTENILDTLKSDESGLIFYKTKSYKSGENKLKFIVKLKMPNGDRQLSRTVSFFVK